MARRARNAFNLRSGADRVYGAMFPRGRADAARGAHRVEHRGVEVDAFAAEVHDAAGLEPAVGGRDRVEDAGQLPLDVVVAAVAGLGGDGDHRVLEDGAAVGLDGVGAVQFL